MIIASLIIQGTASISMKNDGIIINGHTYRFKDHANIVVDKDGVVWENGIRVSPEE